MENKIQEFWRWFIANEQTIVDAINSEGEQDHSYLVNQLDNQVLQFGKFAWEIGFGKNRPYFLTLSPNGDKEQLLISKSIISVAPDLKSWEFNAAKVVVDWDLNFKVYDAEFDAHQIDASNWEQVLEIQDNNQIAVTMKADSISHLDTYTQLKSIDMVITSLLGEELRINKVDHIQFVNEFTSQQNVRKAPIQIILKQVQGFTES